jgi:seryl-tRNA synthetase
MNVREVVEPNGTGEDAIDRAANVLFHTLGADGVYARTALFEQVIEGLMGLISEYREEGTEILRLPPVMSRSQLEKSGYLQSFPHLLGGVCCLHGNDAKAALGHAGADWINALAPTDLVLAPAACYPVYPLAAGRGRVPANGLLFDVVCDCFRREASKHIDRLQSFRMREYVCVGTPAQVVAFREGWLSRSREFAGRLGLTYRIAQASDPFFGRVGMLLAANQLEQSLKFELLVPVRPQQDPTACMSFNYHRDHFGTSWELRTVAGEVAHTGCVAFGMDRLALALFAAHGLNLERWPREVRMNLGFERARRRRG